MGVVQSGTASRPATTVSPQDYMYKSHRFLWSSESANCITASSGCRATRRSAFRGGDALETVSAWRRPGPGRPTQTRAGPPVHCPAPELASLALGNWNNQRCGNLISSLFCCRRRSGRYFDTVYLMFKKSDFTHFSDMTLGFLWGHTFRTPPDTHIC